MDFSAIDYQVFQSINHLAVKLAFLNPIMRFISEEGEYLFYLGIIIYWFTRMKQNRQMVAQALISASVAFGVGGILSYLFYRDRPFVHHHVNLLIHHPANASFPSDHALGAFVIATSIWLFRRKDGVVWIIFGALIALSRVWTGVHYPLDVVAGAFIGVICALSIHWVFAKSHTAQKYLNLCMEIYEKVEKKILFRRAKLN